MKKGITIITRTSNRPEFFKRCRQSIVEQTGVLFRKGHMVISDDPADQYHARSFVLRVQRREGRGHNMYFNEVAPIIQGSWYPWVMFLDDDDHLLRPDALRLITEAMQTEDDLILWQVQFPHGRLVPGAAIGMPPQPGNISGIGFCYHSKHWVDWVGEPYADWRVISELYQSLTPRWIYETLTGLQGEPGHGLRQDKTPATIP